MAYFFAKVVNGQMPLSFFTKKPRHGCLTRSLIQGCQAWGAPEVVQPPFLFLSDISSENRRFRASKIAIFYSPPSTLKVVIKSYLHVSFSIHIVSSFLG